MTTYLAAYDTENERCFPALPQIVRMHERYEMPATFFIVTSLIKGREKDLRALLDHPLFEIASHSHSHQILLKHRRSPATIPVPEDQFPNEILDSARRLEDLFGRPVTGFRPPWGYGDGFRGQAKLLGLLRDGGYRYVSSVLWGPGETLPALILPPFTYADDGYPGLKEIPSCGWHENVLKIGAFNYRDLTASPPPIPEAVVTKPIETPEEEFRMNRLFIDRAAAEGAPHATLVWHPWSLGGFDPGMRMLDMTFRYVRERGLPCRTFAEYAADGAKQGG